MGGRAAATGEAVGAGAPGNVRVEARQKLLEAIRAWDDVRRIQAIFREAEDEALSRKSEERVGC
jgi:hypothetical protein